MTGLDVVVLGRGKVGRTLAVALRRVGVKVRLLAGRTGKPLAGEIVVLALPDGALFGSAERLAALPSQRRPRCVLHCAGALGPEVLTPLTEASVPVAQFHPLASFARPGGTELCGVRARLAGDRRAVAAGRRLCRLLGMVPLEGPLDATGYHAAAALVSNGAVAIVAAATELLVSSGMDARVAASALGSLLATTARNVDVLGLPEALTGPVRRGDAATVARHLGALQRGAPAAVPLFRELVAAQVTLARRFPEGKRASRSALDAVATVVEGSAPLRSRTRKRS